MIVQYPLFCKKCERAFDDFKYKREWYVGGCCQIIRLCPHCGSEIECEFISEEEVKNEM